MLREGVEREEEREEVSLTHVIHDQNFKCVDRFFFFVLFITCRHGWGWHQGGADERRTLK